MMTNRERYEYNVNLKNKIARYLTKGFYGNIPLFDLSTGEQLRESIALHTLMGVITAAILDTEPPKVDDTENNDYWKNITDIYQSQKNKGLKNYGMRLEENSDMAISERLQNIEEEMVDALMYIEHLRAELNEV